MTESFSYRKEHRIALTIIASESNRLDVLRNTVRLEIVSVVDRLINGSRTYQRHMVVLRQLGVRRGIRPRVVEEVMAKKKENSNTYRRVRERVG